MVLHLGALSALKCDSDTANVGPPPGTQCKVYRPWAVFREGTVFAPFRARTAKSLFIPNGPFSHSGSHILSFSLSNPMKITSDDYETYKFYKYLCVDIKIISRNVSYSV